MESRRRFIQNLLTFTGALILKSNAQSSPVIQREKQMNAQTTVYRSINGSSSENMKKVLELIGGIETIIGLNDIVIIKPNVQWWNQGAPNISAVNTFISLIMERPGGFRGEVILAENNHCGSSPWNSAGWQKPFDRNSDLRGINNYNELSNHLKKKFGDKLSICHWIDLGAGNKRVYSPADGTGYVLCDGTGGVPLLSLDNGLQDENRREVIMSYPIFKTDKGTIIDFKNGIWEKGKYTKQSIKFINFSALNHHSNYCGMTSSVKNYLGITDISGGPETKNGAKYYGKYKNFHMFAFDTWEPGPVAGMLGAEIGIFMNKIRKANLNITTAEWIGLSSRSDPPVSHTKTILASTDPVALDYHSAKYVLFPNSKSWIHNPDNEKGPLFEYLNKCSEKTGDILCEKFVDVQSFDFLSNSIQKDDELVVIGDKLWGNNFKSIIKHLILRFSRM